MKPKYSGPNSRKFWDRVNAIKPEKLHSLIYIAGCALQDHELRVLQMIADVEPGARHCRRLQTSLVH